MTHSNELPPEYRAHPAGPLSEAIRLATQNPYEAGYRDGFAHGRLLADHGRAIECLLAALKEIADICQGPAATERGLEAAIAP